MESGSDASNGTKLGLRETRRARAPASKIARELRELHKDISDLLQEFFRGTPDRRGMDLVVGSSDATPRDIDGPEDARSAAEKGVLDTLERLRRDFASSAINETGLYRDRTEDARRCLLDASGQEHSQRTPRKLKFILLGAGISLLAVAPLALYRRYGFNDDDLRQVSNMAQFVEAFAAAVTIFAGWWFAAVFLELRLRSRRALQEIQRCRALIQVIDSHVLSKHSVVRHISRRPLRGADAQARAEDWSPDEVFEYLMYSAALVRIVAKIAVIHAQWVPRPETTREADDLFRISCDIERNCVLKARLMLEEDRHSGGRPK